MRRKTMCLLIALPILIALIAAAYCILHYRESKIAVVPDDSALFEFNMQTEKWQKKRDAASFEWLCKHMFAGRTATYTFVPCLGQPDQKDKKTDGSETWYYRAKDYTLPNQPQNRTYSVILDSQGFGRQWHEVKLEPPPSD